MADSNVVPLTGNMHPAGTVNDDVVEMLREWLGKAERGEVGAAALIVIPPNLMPRWRWCAHIGYEHPLLSGLTLAFQDFGRWVMESYTTPDPEPDDGEPENGAA